MNFLALGFVLLCAPGALLDFALAEWKKDPFIEVRDAYKWLFQATRGGEHAVPSEEMARGWLENEWSGLSEPKENEPVWEPLCKNGEIGRLNLRVFKARGGKMDDVLTAFVQGSKNFDPGKQSKENFISAWSELGKKLKKKPLGKMNGEEWKKLDAEMKAKDYGAVHHSENYEKERHPAYRIMPGDLAKKLLVGSKKE